MSYNENGGSMVSGRIRVIYMVRIRMPGTFVEMRTLLLVLLAGMAHLLFISPVPEAYNGFLPWLALYSIAGISMVFHGIARFKEGVQD